MKNSIASLVIAAWLFVACSPYLTRYDEFNVETNVDRTFFKCLPPPADGASIDVFKCVFDEVLIEDNNLIEVTTRNTESKQPRVTYQVQGSYWRELYLFRFIGREHVYDTSYVYFTAKFKYDEDPKTKQARKVCMGFGPSFFGKVVSRGRNQVIEFQNNLKFHKEDGKFFLCKKTKKASDTVNFVMRWADMCPDALPVSKIVYLNRNKIGGTKDLVFDVDSVFHDKNALQFIYMKSF